MRFSQILSLILFSITIAISVGVGSAGAVKTFYIEGDEIETQAIPGQTLLFINITVVNGSRIDLYIMEEDRFLMIMDQGGSLEESSILIWKNVTTLKFQFYGENATRYYLVMVPYHDLREQNNTTSQTSTLSGSTVNIQIKYEENESTDFFMGVALSLLSFGVTLYGALRKR
ncbi:MAG: hypothetical protein J7L88_04840 [Thermoplasmata archaeon]|nr:hypothetical protein [Thermoplasmata archaeon]